ncbi:NAD-dependent epimerase [Candidatus Thalassolituus haligoni]|uniref:NAD-dependent epimerase n=1 Tax=Candidatus Thalassolituus haligoni TaxID=3100113 RepID=UPI003513DB72
MKALVTGIAGFIGSYVAKRLIANGYEVVGIDNLNDYYDVSLKRARLDWVREQGDFTFVEMDLADKAAMTTLFDHHQFDRVVHLAAQAGVRYSIEHPDVYVASNLVGFVNILEACRHQQTPHLVFASSSSVYGLNSKLPFATSDSVDHPVSLYAATKKSNELMAHTYAHLYGLPVTGLRFFTVYGPWGRPDMAAWGFTKNILAGKTINVYNHGKMRRDFTYIDDIVEGVVRVTERIPGGVEGWTVESGDKSRSTAPYKIYNIGNHNSVELGEFITTLESALGTKANINYMDMQPGDVVATHANVDDLIDDVDFAPNTRLVDGLERFVSWYRQYHGL